MSKIPKILDEAVGFNITRLATLFRRQLTRALAEYDMTPEQWQVLVAIIEAPEPLSQAIICNVTLKDRHSMSKMLEKMEQNGWIIRKSDPDDARASHVMPSRLARAEFDTMFKKLQGAFTPILAHAGDGDVKQLLVISKKLIKVMERMG